MPRLNLGRVRFNWIGEFDPGLSYLEYDCVEWDGQSYVCTQPVTGTGPGDVSGSTYWEGMLLRSDAYNSARDQAIQAAVDAEESKQGADAALAELNTQVADASASADNAADSATASSTSAGESADSAAAALVSEQAAKASETAASTSAGEASDSADAANMRANDAEGFATTATTKASEAADSATAAKTSEDNASVSAGEAATSAQQASDSETAVSQVTAFSFVNFSVNIEGELIVSWAGQHAPDEGFQINSNGYLEVTI